METSSNKSLSLHGKDLNSNCYLVQRPELVASRKLTKMTGCLEIIDGENLANCKSSLDSPSTSRPSSNTSIRPGSQVSMGCVPPRADSSMNRRVNTPTKQITLQAVRRKEESAEPFVDQVDWQSLGLNSNHRQIWELGANSADKGSTKTLVQKEKKENLRMDSIVDTSQHATQASMLKPGRSQKEDTLQMKQSSDTSNRNRVLEMGGKDKNKDEKSDEDDDADRSDDDDDSDSSADEQEEKLRAPNELLMEFVDNLMRKDYPIAKKLCQMILLYEPENPEALKFKPLIEEKLALDVEAENEAADESDDDDDSEDDGDEDDDSNGDSSDDENSSSDDGSPDEDDIINGETGNNNSNNNNKIQFGLNHRSCC